MSKRQITSIPRFVFLSPFFQHLHDKPMITDIPTEKDFRKSGLEFLNLAWEAILQLIIDLEDADCDVVAESKLLIDGGRSERTIRNPDIKHTLSDAYWIAAQKPLGAALALMQQGIEFLLKSKIAGISPYLLIANSHNQWPKKCSSEDVSFSKFKTIDAQDLFSVYNSLINPLLIPHQQGQIQ